VGAGGAAERWKNRAVGVPFRLPSDVQDQLRRSAAAPIFGAVLAVAGLVSAIPAQAQSFTWGGTGSTTTTTDYNLGTNWASPPAGAPPVVAGQSAVFDTTGSNSVVVTAGSVAPNSWTFTAASQSYAISGGAVNFSLAGATGGVIDNANAGQTISIANNIGGSVAGTQVQLLGGSTLVLSGSNTYSGGTTVSGFGTLQAASTGAVGTGAVTLSNGEFQAGGNLTISNNFSINNTVAGSAIDANGFALTLSGNITDGSGGAGMLTVIDSFGGGVVILTGTNTYSGGTTICSCGTLQLGTLATSGSIVGPVTNEGVFNIVNANTAGITSINNNGGLTTFLNSTSAGTIAITNTTGGGTVFGVAFGADTATAGNATITNKLGGGTVFNAMTTAGSATITNRYFGETEFFDNSNAGNATIVNRYAGLTTFNNFSTADNANITNRYSGSTLFFDNSSAGNAVITNNSNESLFGIPVGLGFFDNSTAGNATIINNKNGFIAFGFPGGTDTATAGQATITNNAGSSLEFNAFTTAGNATITTNSGGTVAFFDNSTGGNAQFITNGTGYVDFSGSLGPNGDGRITAGSIAGSGFYYIGDGNTLIVGSNNLSTNVSGVIADFNPCGCGPAGPGSLEKVGTGTMILSGTNTYSGTTTVNGGVLEVDGSIASSSLTTVNANAALTGIGSVGNTTIASGGIFLPGNGTPGTFMTVAGNLAFQSGALYLVQLNSLTSTFASVTGTATLAGTVGASFAIGSEVMKQYTILTAAGGVGGSFAGAAIIGNPGALVATLSYDPTHAYLNFALNYGATTPGLNINQQNVGNTLTNFFNANGGIPAAFATLTPAGLAQASGEVATGTQQATFDAMNLFLGLLTDPFVAGRGNGAVGGAGASSFADEDGASAYTANGKPMSQSERDAYAAIYRKAPITADTFNGRWSVWAAGYGGSQTTTGNTALGSNGESSSVYGTAVGADYRFSPSTLAGFALAGGGTNFSVNGSGSGRSDLFQAGVFVRHDAGPAYVTGALAYGWQDVTTDRTVTIAGVDLLHAEFDANAFSGRVEGGYRFVTPWMGVSPYAAGQFVTYDLPAYAEQVLAGAGTFALNYAAKDVTDARSELGLRTDRSFALEDGILTLRSRLAWAHDFDPERDISAVFQTLPGAAFVVNGAAQAHEGRRPRVFAAGTADPGWPAGHRLFQRPCWRLCRAHAAQRGAVAGGAQWPRGGTCGADRAARGWRPRGGQGRDTRRRGAAGDRLRPGRACGDRGAETEGTAPDRRRRLFAGAPRFGAASWRRHRRRSRPQQALRDLGRARRDVAGAEGRAAAVAGDAAGAQAGADFRMRRYTGPAARGVRSRAARRPHRGGRRLHGNRPQRADARHSEGTQRAICAGLHARRIRVFPAPDRGRRGRRGLAGDRDRWCRRRRRRLRGPRQSRASHQDHRRAVAVGFLLMSLRGA
jgi:autotransporter-associated beta strand protein